MSPLQLAWCWRPAASLGGRRRFRPSSTHSAFNSLSLLKTCQSIPSTDVPKIGPTPRKFSVIQTSNRNCTAGKANMSFSSNTSGVRDCRYGALPKYPRAQTSPERITGGQHSEAPGGSLHLKTHNIKLLCSVLVFFKRIFQVRPLLCYQQT